MRKKEAETNCRFDESMKTEFKELKRKMDLMARAISNNPYVQDSNQSFLDEARKRMPFISMHVVGKKGLAFDFLCRSNDIYVTKHMWDGFRGVHSEKEMNLFIEFAEKYYGITPKENRIFCDIGGNIGTTSVYIKKRWPKIKVVSFEPSRDNCKIFKTNCILNDVSVELKEIGLGVQNEETKLSLSEDNMGNHRVWNDSMKMRKTEDIHLSTFDDEMNERFDGIDYIWMDVEGYEGFVLEGMRKFLRNRKVPMWTEFSPKMLREAGCFEQFIDILSRYYAYFIDRHNADCVQPIESLQKVADSLENYDATDIFLIAENR